MSLINKMLQDLDRRTGGSSRVNTGLGAQGLGPITGYHQRSARPLWLAGGFAMSVCIGVVLWWSLAGNTDSNGTRQQGLAAQTQNEQNSTVSAPLSTVAKTQTAPTAQAKPLVAQAKQVAAKPAPRAVTTEAVKQAKPVAVATIAAATASKPKALVQRQSKTRPKTSSEQGVRKTLRAATPLQQANQAYEQALTLLTQQPQLAQQQLRQALQIYPAHVQAREQLARVLIKRGQWQQAQQLLQQGINTTPAYYRFAQWLARIQAEHNALSQAVATLEHSRLQAAGDPEYLALLAALYQRNSQHALAARTYQQAIQAQPRRGKLWLGLAISLEAEKDYNAARQAYERANANGLAPSLQQYAQQRLAALR